MPMSHWAAAAAGRQDFEAAVRSEASGYAAGVAAWMIAASAFIVVKAVSDEMPPWTMGFLRVLIILAIMLPLVARHHAEMTALLRARWAEVLFIGAIGLGLTQGVLYTALQMTTAVNVAIVFGLAPMLTLTLARFILGEPMTTWQALGSAIAFCGIVVISVKGDLDLLSRFQFGAGEIVAFVSALLFAGYTVLLKRARFDLPCLPLLTLLMFGGALTLFPFFVWEFASGRHENLALNGYFGLLYMASISGVGMFFLYNRSIEILGAAQAGTLVYTQMVFVAIFAWIFLGERLQPYHYAGAALVAAGIVLVVRFRGRVPAGT